MSPSDHVQAFRDLLGGPGACPTTGTELRVDYTADYIFYE